MLAVRGSRFEVLILSMSWGSWIQLLLSELSLSRETYVVLDGSVAVTDKLMGRVAAQDLFDSVLGWESGWSVCGSAPSRAGSPRPRDVPFASYESNWRLTTTWGRDRSCRASRWARRAT